MKYKNGWNVAKTKLACNHKCNRIIAKGERFYFHSICRNKFECKECEQKQREESKKIMQSLNRELSVLFR